jgi:hypothetical protein
VDCYGAGVTFYRAVEVVDPDDANKIYMFDLNEKVHCACFNIRGGPEDSPIISWSDLHCLYSLPDGTTWAEHGYYHDYEDCVSSPFLKSFQLTAVVCAQCGAQHVPCWCIKMKRNLQVLLVTNTSDRPGLIVLCTSKTPSDIDYTCHFLLTSCGTSGGREKFAISKLAWLWVSQEGFAKKKGVDMKSILPRAAGAQELFKRKGRFHSRCQNIEYECWVNHGSVPDHGETDNAYFWTHVFDPVAMTITEFK